MNINNFELTTLQSAAEVTPEPEKVESEAEKAIRMKSLDDKYLVDKQESGLENEPLKDLSGDIEKLSGKERTKQILDGLKRSGAGALMLGIMPAIGYSLGPTTGTAIAGAVAIGLLVGPATYIGAKESTNGIKMIVEAIKGNKSNPPAAELDPSR